MIFEKFKVLGIMSGTSLDGVDFAVVDFQLINNIWSFKIKETKTFSYPKEWFEKLKFAAKLPASEIVFLNEAYTKYLNELIHQFINDNNVEGLDAIASHGHTILHNPKAGYTLQIGNLQSLKNNIDCPIICDFRVQDVKLGGQGAPLVPIGDRFLFSNYDFCLNLGGFSNISFERDGERIAFDICPVNTVLNYYANKINLEYDADGKVAQLGQVSLDLLKELNANPFFSKSFPKSLGIEFVFEEVIPLISTFELEIKDILATYVEHIAFQISIQLLNSEGKMIITGGGAFNSFLIRTIKKYTTNIEIERPNAEIINYKEALIFAFLGILKLKGEINVLSSVTGAQRDHSSGMVL